MAFLGRTGGDIACARQKRIGGDVFFAYDSVVFCRMLKQEVSTCRRHGTSLGLLKFLLICHVGSISLEFVAHPLEAAFRQPFVVAQTLLV